MFGFHFFSGQSNENKKKKRKENLYIPLIFSEKMKNNKSVVNFQ